MTTNCQSEHADVSSDDEQEIMKRNWRKNISTIEKVVFNIPKSFRVKLFINKPDFIDSI